MPETRKGTRNPMDAILSQEQASQAVLYPPTLMGSHLDLDLSLVQNDSPHTVHDLPSGFLNKAGSSESLPAAMHVSLADISPPGNLSGMHILDSASQAQDLVQTFIPDFPTQTDSFGMQVNGDEHIPVQSNPNAGPALNNSSQLPLLDGREMPATYSVGTSSLATALDSIDGPIRRSPPSSSISSGNPTSISERDSSSGESGPRTTANGSFFSFTPSEFSDDRVEAKGESTDVSHDPHRLVVVNLFQDMKKMGQQARAACAVGQNNEAGMKIERLMQLLTLATDLVAAAPSLDSINTGQEHSPPSYHPSNSNAQVPSPEASGLRQTQFATVDVGSIKPDAMDVQGNYESRKRCASSLPVGDDRVNKALKRELQDDKPLVVPPATNASPPVHQANTLFPHLGPPPPVPATIDPRSITSYNPSSQPPSHPPSPPDLIAEFKASPSKPHSAPAFPHVPNTPVPSEFDPNTSTPTTTRSPAFPAGAGNRSSWSDSPSTLPQRRHPHSLSSGSISSLAELPGRGALSYPNAGPCSSSVQPLRPTATASVVSPPIGRVSRSGSVSSGFGSPFAFSFPDVSVPNRPLKVETYDHQQSRPSTGKAEQRSGDSSPINDDDSDSELDEGSSSPSRGIRRRLVLSHDGTGQSGTDGILSHYRDDVPQEYREEVDRVFFEFLTSICSNLDAVDSKGEAIHQTLMAKKMQRLDESPDFRPFKFRIQAFTHAFLEELAAQGYPEDKIPMKKVRNYLWSQPHIARYNEDGKKSKSKGNHIWIVDAKKTSDGWVFRPFRRRLTGPPLGVAYVGLPWSWKPRVWFPQGGSENRGHNRTRIPVKFSSPAGSMPSWLSWKGDTLSGTPPAFGADGCDVTVEAFFTLDGQEEHLIQTIHIDIAPITAIDTSFPASRRPPLGGVDPRRVASDSSGLQTRTSRTQTASVPPSPVQSQDQQVMQVLTTAAQRVAEEAQTQVIAASPREQPGPELQALAKQQHVLTLTAQAFDEGVAGQRSHTSSPSKNSTVLAAAAQQVVFQAARQVAADRSAAAVAVQVSVGIPPLSTTPNPQVTVNEVSVATQTAVAQAVEITGPLSSEVDVLMTASSLLQRQARPLPGSTQGALDPSQLATPETRRHHSTGTLLSRQFPSPLETTASGVSVPFPSL